MDQRVYSYFSEVPFFRASEDEGDWSTPVELCCDAYLHCLAFGFVAASSHTGRGHSATISTKLPPLPAYVLPYWPRLPVNTLLFLEVCTTIYSSCTCRPSKSGRQTVELPGQEWNAGTTIWEIGNWRSKSPNRKAQHTNHRPAQRSTVTKDTIQCMDRKKGGWEQRKEGGSTRGRGQHAVIGKHHII